MNKKNEISLLIMFSIAFILLLLFNKTYFSWKKSDENFLNSLIREKNISKEIIEKKNREIFLLEENIKELSGISKKEAKTKLIEKTERSIKEELNYLIKKITKDTKKRIFGICVETITSSLEKVLIEHNSHWNQSERIEIDQITLGKIIGAGKKNINSFKKITGCELFIQKKKRKKGGGEEEYITVEVSNFNSLKRYTATLVLKELIEKQRISPDHIKKVFENEKKKIENSLSGIGKEIITELNLDKENISSEIQHMLGKSRYMSAGYGQNLESHLKEVAVISSCIASNLGLDPLIAKRAGLLHDIGKTTGDSNISHVMSGVEIAKKFGEGEIIINVIESHHDRTLANNVYSFIVSMADKISAGRKGVRNNQIESYTNRIKELEKIKEEFSPRVKQVYIFQSGREIIIEVNPDIVIDDYEVMEISQEIRRYIQKRIIIPGDSVINVIRERKITEKIVNSGRSSREDEDEIY